jgi:hypothetical protein
MVKQAAAGPSGTAQWTEKELIGAASHPVTVLLLPDAANGPVGGAADRPDVYYYLPKVPRLTCDTEGNPRYSLSLVLSRRPSPDDPSITPLIEHGLLAFTVSLGVPADVFSQRDDAPPAEFQALFARQIVCSLEPDDPSGKEALASVSGSGAAAELALSTHVDHTRALGVLAALDGNPSGLRLRTEITYRTATSSLTVHLFGSWSAIFDAIDANLDVNGNISPEALRACFADMLQTQVISATEITSSGDEVPLATTESETLFQAFLRVASFILQKDTTGIDPKTAQVLYSLRGRPSPAMPLDLRQTLSGSAQKTLVLLAPLDEVLGGALDTRDRSRFIQLIGPTGGTDTGLGPIPRLLQVDRPSGRSRDPQNSKGIQLAATGTAIKSMALALTPDTRVPPSAHALLASDVVHGGLRVQDRLHWLADDVLVPQQETAALSLPQVGDPSAPVWPDYIQPSKYWYAPALVPVQPTPNMSPSSSPFLFTFTQSGVTGGSHAAPGLNGSVRFTLQAMMTDATRAQLKALGNPPATPVPRSNLSVALELPFREESTGVTKSQLFVARVEEQGDTVTATVDLLDDWVRLCYGALAYPGFQTQPARLSVAYCYRAYVGVRLHFPPRFEFAPKTAVLPVAESARDVPGEVVQPVFNVADNTVHLPSGELQFQREPPRSASGSPPPVWTLRGRLKALGAAPARTGSVALAGATHRLSSLTAPATALAAPASHPAVSIAATAVVAARPAAAQVAVVAHPQLAVAPALVSAVGLIRWVIQTVVHQENQVVLYPCATLGAFYQQITADGPKVVGCQDALRLGQINYRQYEEITELAQPLYRVYRSLQQPGRFLVLPATYRITRYGPEEAADKAYRPVIMIYGVIDADPAKNRYFFTATLQPDIPYYERRALQDKLVPLSPSGHAPHLDLPTDPAVQCTTTYRWALPSGVEQPDVQQTWDSFQVSLSTGLTNALTLTTLIESDGIAGTATFTLPDGLVLSSRLSVDTTVIGPWQTGPLSVRLSPGSASLTNMIEQPVNVFDLVTRHGSGPAQQVKADLTMAPATSGTVTLPAPADEAYPVYAVVPGHLTLKQLNIFVEDVVTNVIFVNLANYANHALSKLEIQARLKDLAQTYPVPISEGQSASVDITLPLTNYLENRVLQFQVTKTATAGQTTATAWLEWDLTAKGNVVSLTWELIQ